MKDRLYKPSTIKKIMGENAFSFSKKLGQNFLIDGNIVKKIGDISRLTEEDGALEIGPGFGSLTEELSLRAKKVLAVELDSRLIDILKNNLKDYENLVVMEGDALEIGEEVLKDALSDCKNIRLVANLPYYITSPIIIRYLKMDFISSMTIMVQKEMGDRILAEKDNKDYGSLTLYCSYYSEAKMGIKVPKTCFMPRPQVDSVVIHLEKKEDYFEYEDLMFSLIRSAFNQRRKTLPNSLQAALYGLDKEKIREVLEENGLDERMRAENLDLDDFKNLARDFSKLI